MTKNFKIGSVVSLGIAGLVAILIIWIYSLKADKAQLEWDLAAKDAEIDTVWIAAEYSIPETVFVSRVKYDTTEGRIDTTFYEIPQLHGSIKIDTTKVLGPDSNPMLIRVAGEFYYPEEYSYKNWLLIHPVIGTPYKPAKLQFRNWGINTDILISSKGWAGAGLTFKYKRFSVGAGKYFGNQPWVFRVGYSVFGRGGS